MLEPEDAAALERAMASGGIALFGADTVYGLACDPSQREPVERLARLKGRPAAKPSAVLFFSSDLLFDAVEMDAETRTRAAALLPGAVTLLIPNTGRCFPLACGEDQETLGVRVPALAPSAAALATVGRPILQSSANRAGGAEARRVGDVEPALRAAVDLVLDAGELPGVASTIIDLRSDEPAIVREGAVPAAEVARRLRSAP